MTKTIFIISAFVIITNTFCSERAKEKYFERHLVNAFKHQDFNEFKKIIITPEDLEAGFSSSTSGLLSIVPPDNKALVEEYKKTYINDYRIMFDQIIAQGKTLGIIWNKINYESFLYNINNPIAGSGIQLLNGHINIKVKDKYYFFYGIDAQEYRTRFKVSYIRSVKQGLLKEYVNSNSTPEPKL